MISKKRQSPRYEYMGDLIKWGVLRLKCQAVKDLIFFCLYRMNNDDCVVPFSGKQMIPVLGRRRDTIARTILTCQDLGVVAGCTELEHYGNKFEAVVLSLQVPKMSVKEANELIKRVVTTYSETVSTGGGYLSGVGVVTVKAQRGLPFKGNVEYPNVPNLKPIGMSSTPDEKKNVYRGQKELLQEALREVDKIVKPERVCELRESLTPDSFNTVCRYITEKWKDGAACIEKAEALYQEKHKAG